MTNEESIEEYINEINKSDNINIKDKISKFEKKLKKCFKLYSEKSGYEDYKMNNIDKLILYTLWKNSNIYFNIDELLVIIYGYYKLEEIYFPVSMFNIDNNIFQRIHRSNINQLISIFMKI